MADTHNNQIHPASMTYNFKPKFNLNPFKSFGQETHRQRDKKRDISVHISRSFYALCAKNAFKFAQNDVWGATILEPYTF